MARTVLLLFPGQMMKPPSGEQGSAKTVSTDLATPHMSFTAHLNIQGNIWQPLRAETLSVAIVVIAVVQKPACSQADAGREVPNPALSVPTGAQEPLRRLRGRCFPSRAQVMAHSIFSEDVALLPTLISAVKWACSALLERWSWPGALWSTYLRRRLLSARRWRGVWTVRELLEDTTRQTMALAALCAEERGCWPQPVGEQGYKVVPCHCSFGCWGFAPLFVFGCQHFVAPTTELKEDSQLFPRTENNVALLSCHVSVKGGSAGRCGRPSE